MDSARNISKTTLPDLSRAIPRPRLIQQIRESGNARVILITGQAAQGKSTLAAETIRRQGHVAAWMHLESADSDPVNFLHLLAHALKATHPSLDIAGFLKHPAIALGSKSVSDRIAEQVGELLNAIIAREPVRIVIDGLDELSAEAASLAIIDRIVDIISPPSCLILVSRATPPLNLESLRVRQELVVLNNSDLAFTTDEIYQFYASLYGLELAAPELLRIREITDGWVGGLVLIREVLRQIPEDHRAAYIHNGLPAALQGEYLSYFSETVFAGLDEKIRNFLIKTAIFDIIQPKVMTHYFGNQTLADTEAILAHMVRQNLFVHRLYDPADGWGYRYNQLFRDFLKDKFKHSLSAEKQQRLVTRAADLAWDVSNYEGAIRFFIKAGKYEKAAAGIKKIAMGLCAQGRFADLTGWIDVLPQFMIQDDAWLSFYAAMGRRISGGRRNISTFAAALERFESENDRRGQLLALAYLIEAAVFVGHPATVLKDWLDAARTMLAKASRSQYYAFAKAVLWMQMAFGYLAGTGDLQSGLSACRNALLLAGTIEDETLIVNATIIHAFGFTLAGEFNRAENALAGIGHLATATYPEYRTLTNIIRLELALSGGNLDRAQRLLDEIRKDIDAFGLLFLYPLHVDLTGRFQIYKGRFDALGRTANHLEDVATLAANPFYHGLAMRLRALKAYHQGHLQRAGMWAHQAVEIVEKSLGESIHLSRCRMILGMVAYHQHDLSTARQELESARDFFSRESSHLSLAEAHFGLSLVERKSEDGAVVDRHLESALAVVASQGYEVFPILSTRDILAACLPARLHDRLEISRLACRIVDRMQPEPIESPSEIRSGGAAPEHSATAMAIPDTTHPVLDIRTLGGFVVCRGDGNVISDAQWAGHRQKLLLKAIVVNGCREIPKDVLMDALWPESSADAALKRFKVTLHRLRRILEPDLSRKGGSSCISLKDSLINLDMLRCRVDVNEFLAVCDKIRQLKRDEDDDRLLSACRRAVGIYRGDFLHEEPYLSWAETKRVALRDRYLAVLLDLADLCESNGMLEEAARHYSAVIQADPLSEQAHQQLMRLFQRQGRRSAAIKIYRDLTQTLSKELETTPDPATMRLYESIVNGSVTDSLKLQKNHS